eukprot:SAG11_NODE_5082_length_1669_cov_1.608280_1_plen_179_part_00
MLGNTSQVAMNVVEARTAVASFVSLGARCSHNATWFGQDWSSIDLTKPNLFPVSNQLFEFCYQEQLIATVAPACDQAGAGHIPDPGKLLASRDSELVASFTAEIADQKRQGLRCKPPCRAAMSRHYRMCKPVLDARLRGCLASWGAQPMDAAYDALSEWGEYMVSFGTTCENLTASEK